VLLLIGMAGCTAVERPSLPPLEQIAVTDFSSVAGDWEGRMVRSPPTRSSHDDWVHLTIQPDGAFHFKAYRTIGVFSGTGVFTLEDGALLVTSDRGNITARLYRHAGTDDRVIQADGTSRAGVTYRAELTPARRR
jgi:hypothetical protein